MLRALVHTFFGFLTGGIWFIVLFVRFLLKIIRGV